MMATSPEYGVSIVWPATALAQNAGTKNSDYVLIIFRFSMDDLIECPMFGEY